MINFIYILTMNNIKKQLDIITQKHINKLKFINVIFIIMSFYYVKFNILFLIIMFIITTFIINTLVISIFIFIEKKYIN